MKERKMNRSTGWAWRRTLFEDEAPRKHGPCISARFPRSWEWRRPHHPCRASATQGSTWISARALRISSSLHAKIGAPSPLPPVSEMRPAHGAGWLTRCARAFQIPSGAIGAKLIDSELSLRDFSGKSGIAAFHSVWARPSRPSSLRCGTC